MTTRAEHYGAELVMLLRRRQELLAEVERVTGQIDKLNERIFTETPTRLYGEPTGEIPQVPDERPTQVTTAWVECPGADCWMYRQGQQHLHRDNGQIYSNSYHETS